jgi:hypothetical protein
MPHKDPEARKAYHRAYYLSHLDEQIAAAKANYIANREERRVQRKTYHAVNAVKQNARCKIYQATHAEETKAQRAAYRSAHREELRETTKRFCASHIVEIICLHCGKKVNVYAFKSRRFCSKKCADRWSVGSNAPNWQGGKSFEPYCPKFNDEFKRRVRAFFDNSCLVCGKTEKLCVHHCDYDKKVCCNDRPPAFVCLCNKHNLSANNNRDRWSYMFHYIIDEIYDGKCYFTKEEFGSR